jgi:hypothetical protein
MGRRMTIAALVGVAATNVAGVGGGGGAAAADPPCSRADSTTLLTNSVARVYRVPERSTRSFRVIGCAFATDYEVALDQATETYAYLPPAISLDGSVIGYGLLVCPDEGDCQTRVYAEDLANNGLPVYGNDAGAPANGRARPRAVKIGSLRLKRNGSRAWIACPERSDPEFGPGPEPASRRPNCVKAGSLDRVYKLEAPSDRPELLDKGRDIDPSSLRRKGSTISWVAGGKRRRATLE